MPKPTLVGFFSAVCLLFGCAPSSDQLRKALEKHPDVVFDVLEKNPERFVETLQKASTEYRKVAQKRAEEESQKQLEEEFKNPKTPNITDDRAALGEKNAPVTLVTYSDFQCPYCKKGYDTVEELRKKYGNKLLFVFKNLPLEFHDMAMPAAKRFEAIALQSAAKAYKFHDEVFKSQGKLNSGKGKFLDEVAKKVGADVAKMKKDLDSEQVTGRIKADMEEAKKFDISGTPGFVVGGITVKGAYPVDHFVQIIDRRLRSAGCLRIRWGGVCARDPHMDDPLSMARNAFEKGFLLNELRELSTPYSRAG